MELSMTNESLDKAYSAQEVEGRWYSFWENQELFKADPNRPGQPFSIVIPPPNVTGNLHMGHALNNTLQDILVRYHRMKGHNVLWVPGMDRSHPSRNRAGPGAGSWIDPRCSGRCLCHGLCLDQCQGP